MVRKEDGEMPQMQYKTPEEFEARIDEYFDNTPIEKQTRAGLYLHLGMSKQTFWNYCTKYPKYQEIAEMALTRLEYKYELKLNERGGTEAIFALKQYGWADKQEVENKMSGGIEIVSSIPRPKEE